MPVPTITRRRSLSFPFFLLLGICSLSWIPTQVQALCISCPMIADCAVRCAEAEICAFTSRPTCQSCPVPECVLKSAISGTPLVHARPTYLPDMSRTEDNSNVVLPAMIQPLRLLANTPSSPKITGIENTPTDPRTGEATTTPTGSNTGGTTAIIPQADTDDSERPPFFAIAASVGAIAFVAFGAVAIVARRRAAASRSELPVARTGQVSKKSFKDRVPHRPVIPVSRMVQASKKSLKGMIPHRLERKPTFTLGAESRMVRGSFGSLTSHASSDGSLSEANVITYLSPNPEMRQTAAPQLLDNPFADQEEVPAIVLGTPYNLGSLFSDLASDSNASYKSMSVNSVSTGTRPDSSASTYISAPRPPKTDPFADPVRYSSASSAPTVRDPAMDEPTARRVVQFRSHDSLMRPPARRPSSASTYSSITSSSLNQGVASSPALPTLAFSQMSWGASNSARYPTRTPSQLRQSVDSDATNISSHYEPPPLIEMNHGDSRIRGKGTGHARARSVRLNQSELELSSAAAHPPLPPLDTLAAYPAALGHGWSMAK
ncbi:hypothetical protein DFJ77DRAFT_480318 [Powellomyces hirtus]|nr:hypothetical protein DFJ77DRAFT_480318 [Powellomyces hirtus]